MTKSYNFFKEADAAASSTAAPGSKVSRVVAKGHQYIIRHGLLGSMSVVPGKTSKDNCSDCECVSEPNHVGCLSCMLRVPATAKM